MQNFFPHFLWGRAPALFPAYHSSPLPIPQDHLGILKNALARSREIRYNGSKNPLGRELRKGTEGWKLCPQLEGFDGKRFEKHTFGSRECADYAAKGGYDQIELIGVCTDICVVSNALLLKAYLPETPIQVDAACCAGVTPESHRAALETMKMCQIDVK